METKKSEAQAMSRENVEHKMLERYWQEMDQRYRGGEDGSQMTYAMLICLNYDDIMIIREGVG